MNQEIHVVIEHLRDQVTDISYIMLAAAKKLAEDTGGKVVALLLGHEAEHLSQNLNATQVMYFNHPNLAEFTPDAYIQVLSDHLKKNQPLAVLLGHTSIGMDIASCLSARMNLPVVSQCLDLSLIGNTPGFISQICGGKIVAEGALPTPTALVTVIPGKHKPEKGQSSHPPDVTSMIVPHLEDLRVTLRSYIEPEMGDVDISKESILVAVGRGIQNEDDLELVDELAEALGGAVCASRPIVDQGWLATSRLVGKSGQQVKAKLYLALGISGAPEHVEGISDSEMIIAINNDPTAPIFNIAKYGAEVDLYDFIDSFIGALN